MKFSREDWNPLRRKKIKNKNKNKIMKFSKEEWNPLRRKKMKRKNFQNLHTIGTEIALFEICKE